MATQEHADDFPATAEAWGGLIAVLAQDRDRAEADLAGIADRRRPLSLRSATGDAKAQQEVNRLNTEDAATRAQIATLAEALADAEMRCAAAAATEAAARAEARRERLAEAAKAQLALAAEVDTAAAALARANAAYDDALRTLAGLGLDGSARRKLSNRTMRASALHFAGMAETVPLPPVSPHHRMPLRLWTQKIIGHHAGEVAPPPVMQPSFIGMPAAAPQAPAEEIIFDEAAEERLAQRLFRGGGA